MPGSIAGAPGFSTSQTSIADSPGLIDVGRASKVTMRAGGPPRPRPAGGAPCLPAGASAETGAGTAGAPAGGCCAYAATVSATRIPTDTMTERLTSPSQNDPNDPNV